MSVVVKEKKEMAESKNKINKVIPQEYGCEIVIEKITIDQAKDFSFPNDAYLIWYTFEGKQYIDLTRCSKKVNLFDMYYDKYGPGSIIKIDFGYGRVNPKLWGYKQPEKKKRK